jgi:hypothetical protein
MNANKYEQFVAEILEGLACFRSAKIARNRKFRGVRQPGSYEIDISLEIPLGEVASVLVIVECKNWRKPVDRPVIQTLVQTRDAIAAHKAAVVSPHGFTSQALQVARVHGVALWVVTRTTFQTVIFAGQSGRRRSLSPVVDAFIALRGRLYKALNVDWYQDSAYTLIEPPESFSGSFYDRRVQADDDFQTPLLDRAAAPSQVVSTLFHELLKHTRRDQEPATILSLDVWMAETSAELGRLGLNTRQQFSGIEAIVEGDITSFKGLFSAD